MYDLPFIPDDKPVMPLDNVINTRGGVKIIIENSKPVVSVDWGYLERDRILELCDQRHTIEDPCELFDCLALVEAIIGGKWCD